MYEHTAVSYKVGWLVTVEQPITNHVVAWQQFLQKISFFMLNGFDDKLIIIRDVEDASTGAGIWQLLQWIVAQRNLQISTENFT